MAFFGNGLEDGGNQVGFGGQGDEFLGTGLDGIDRTIDVIADATRDNRDIDPFTMHGFDQGCNIKGDVSHDKIDPVACAQDIQRCRDTFGQLDCCAACHRDLAGCADLTAQSTNDQYLHSLISFRFVPNGNFNWRVSPINRNS